MDNVSKEIEELNTAIEIKNVFDGLISRLNIAEKRISEPKNMSIETFKIERTRGQNWKKIYIYTILYIRYAILDIKFTIIYKIYYLIYKICYVIYKNCGTITIGVSYT